MTGVRDRFPVSLNGRKFMIDLAKYRRQTVDPQRAMVDQSGDVGEQTLMQPGQWKRTGSDWTLGAGQEHFDLEDSERRRFEASCGVDVWDRRALTLLKDTSRVATWTDLGSSSIDSQDRSYLFTFDGKVCWAYSANFAFAIYEIDNSSLRPWTMPTATHTTGQAIRGLDTDGNYIYYVTSAGYVYRIDRASAVNRWNTSGSFAPGLDPDFLACAADRVLSADGDLAGSGKLMSLTAGSSVTDIVGTSVWTYGLSARSWVAATGGRQGIYLADINTGSNDWLSQQPGATSTIYFTAVDDATTALTSPRAVAQLPVGETVTTLAYYQGFLLIGTNKGFRVAQLEQDGSIIHGPLVEIDGNGHGVLCFEPRGQYVYFGWSNYNSVQTGIGRMDLARFTSPLVPAYASDLMTPVADEIQGNVTSIVFDDDGLCYFCVEEVGVYGESPTDYVEYGTLDVGRVSYNTAEPKRFYSLEAASLANPAGASIIGTVVDAEGNGSATITSITATDDTFDRGDVDETGEWLNVHFDIYPGTSRLTTPTLTRWSLRAVPLPDRIEEIYLPLMISDAVRMEPGPDVGLDPWTEFDWLKALMSSRAVVPLVMGNEEISVYVDGIYTGQDGINVDQWTQDESWVRGLWLVKLVVVPASSSTPTVPTVTVNRFGDPAATYTVAAVDSTAANRAAADFTCDGVNDHVEIQQALDDLAGVGGRVLMLEGNYYLGAGVTIDTDRVVLQGQGQATRLQYVYDSALGAMADAIVVGTTGNRDRCELRDFSLMLGTLASTTLNANGGNGITFHCNGGTIDNVQVSSPFGDGIRIGSYYEGQGTVSASTPTTLEDTGIGWTANEHAGRKVLAMGGTPSPDGIATVNEARTIVSNTADTLTVSSAWTVNPTAAYTYVIYEEIFEVLVSACTVLYPNNDGFVIHASVLNSEFYRDIVIGGNRLGTPRTRYGFLQSGAANKFLLCHPYFCLNDGMRHHPYISGQESIFIIGGEYENNGLVASGERGFGIAIINADSVVISGTLCYGNASTDGDIFLSYTSRSLVLGNMLRSVGTNIYLFESDNNQVKDNECQNSVYAGIRLQDSEKNMITGNRVGNMSNAGVPAAYGIRLQASAPASTADNLVAHNTVLRSNAYNLGLEEQPLVVRTKWATNTLLGTVGADSILGSDPVAAHTTDDGFGTAAFLDVGYAPGTVAAGDDARFFMVAAHSHAGVYDPAGTGAIEAAAAVVTHAGLADPHPGYLTPAEGAAAYDALGASAAVTAALAAAVSRAQYNTAR